MILENTKNTLEEKIKEIEQSKTQIENGISQIENEISSGKQELQNAQNQIDLAKKQIETAEKNLASTKKTTYAKIDSGKTQIQEAKNKIITAQEELEKNKQEFDEKIKEAEGKIIDAKEEISQIENATWYILDRNSNVGYVSLVQDTESIANLGAVFPIVFFVIATLISLTSMTRMVEEQRVQIGTLKALGYNKMQIAGKYVIYAALACIIGGILGTWVGFITIPKIIWKMYSMMYTMPDMQVEFNIKYALIGLLTASICIIGATIYASIKELLCTPAELMRPKAPKKGKRVLLEKIPFIWKRLNFTRKVTVRNMFRYKKRFLMTVIGIMGCTALIVTGFGIRDSIKSIPTNQYEKVFNYDMQISLKNSLDENQKQRLIEKIKENEQITKIVELNMKSETAKNENKEQEVQIIVLNNENEEQDLINLIDTKTKEKIKVKPNEICLTDKTADLLGVGEGDYITLENSNNKEEKVKISNVVENYVSHYIYMPKDMYENLYEKYDTNVVFMRDNELDEKQEETLAKELMQENEVGGINLISSSMRAIDNTMKSLNYVVIILIVSAGLLAFVVLYNLANVNISERIRELATIKVLGFYDKEVYSYISRESTVLTIMGILIGLFAGNFLNIFIMKTCEINTLRFACIIEPQSYIYSVAITLIFTAIVNIVTYFALKKIDMIESLKSVE